jgi:pimeloyl-ACP methyl ester carboxylesterase
LVSIGGIQQWVTVKGQSRENPVLLIVHGGPGNPNTPFADNLFGEWSKDFTVVQWDQRGAGKTYGANKPAEDEALTLDRMAQDGVEVARYAAAGFGKRKVILMGGSWGSALAVSMAQAAPELFHAYVGTAQLVSGRQDTMASYQHTLALARAANDVDAVGKLEKLGTPPWTDPRAFGVLRRVTRKYEAKVSDPAPENWFSFGAGYDTPEYRAAYEAGEDYSYLQFVGLQGNGIEERIDLPASATRFAMPVYLLQGENDLVTPAEVSRAYFDRISAPAKKFITLPRTGHDPNEIMLSAQLAALRRVRPAAIKADRP